MDGLSKHFSTIFWVECNSEIGMGHCYESIYLARFLKEIGVQSFFMLEPYAPALKIIASHNFQYSSPSHLSADSVITQAKKLSNPIVIINHRSVSIEDQLGIKYANMPLVIIDQMGQKKIYCDILINRSVNKEWLQYSFQNYQPMCLFGAEFAIIDTYYRELNNSQKKISNKKITVSMGGIDRTGATLRIIEALKCIMSIKKEIIIGKGFLHMKELNQIEEKLDDSFVFEHSVSDLGRRMLDADIVISAGGNTLYEMACVGAPGIVLWEDPHENIQANAFEERKLLINLGNGIRTPLNDISNAISELLDNRLLLQNFSDNGKRFVDGRAGDRISKLIGEMSQR